MSHTGWGCAPSGVQAVLSLERPPLINSQTKHMFPSRPPSHLPLGNERTSAQFLAGGTDRRPSAPEAPAWINTAGLCLPRVDQPGQASSAEALGLRPQAPGVTFHPYLARLAAPRSNSIPGKWEEKTHRKGKLIAGLSPPPGSLPRIPPCWAQGHCPLPSALPSLTPTSSHLPPWPPLAGTTAL